MSEVNLWKIVDKLESITENLEDINHYLDQIHETHEAFNQWIQVATQSLTELQKQVKYLNEKKAPI